MPSSRYKISIEENPSKDDILIVREGLQHFNRLHVPDDNYQPMVLFLRDPDGTIVGGLLGETYWGWMHIGILWLRESVRRQGFGSQLLTAAEEEAARRGCRGVHLDTMSFQALPFYLRHGYQVFGELEDLPPGNRRIFLFKKFA
jgi:GNAT superfamily N-acetyltransferase